MMVYLGPWHPEKPDPDCDCYKCKIDHLTDEDRTWLESHGWRPDFVAYHYNPRLVSGPD